MMSETTAAAGHVPKPVSKSLNRPMVTVTVMIAAILQTLDNTIANVALPSMQGNLSATQDQISWVLTSYIVAAAITTPLSGWMCNRFGRKQVFAISVGGFTLTSALCGLAQTLPEVVMFRTLQGILGAALMPVSQAILFDINPPEKQARAMSIWTLGATVGPMLGPVLGGWLTDQYNWRWVFFINVPIGALAFIGTVIFVPNTVRLRRSFDMLGFILLSLAVGSLQLMLDRGQLRDWFDSTEIVVEAVSCALALYLFVIHSATTREPFLRPALLGDRNFMAGSSLIFVVGVVLFSIMSLLPPLLQHLLGESPTEAGVVIGWRGVVSLFVLLGLAPFAQRLGPRRMILGGLAMLLWSAWVLTVGSPQMDSRLVLLSSVIQGVGSSIIIVFVAAQSFKTLSPELRTEAASFFSLMRNLGASVGIAAMEAFFISRAQTYHSYLAEHVTRFSLPHTHLLPALHLARQTQMQLLNVEITRQAEWLSYVNTFRVIAVIALVSMPLILLFRSSKGRAPPAVAVAAE